MGTLLILCIIGSVLVLHRLYAKSGGKRSANGGHSPTDPGFVPPPGDGVGFHSGTNWDAGGGPCDSGGGCDGG